VKLNPKVQLSMIPHMDYPLGIENLRMGMLRFVVKTSHMLQMQNDGYVTHPELWNDSWLGYDFIGSPWLNWRIEERYRNRYRVGCVGFSLKSVKFMDAVVDVWRRGYEMPKYTVYGDVWEARYIRGILENDYGIVFAPVMEAIKFSIEVQGEEWAGWKDEQSFGFHELDPIEGVNPGRKKVDSVEGDVITLEGEANGTRIE
jgi:hypothetical protein